MMIAAGLSNAAVLALINASANLKRNERGSMFSLGLMFILVVAAYTVSQRFVMTAAAKEVERIIHRIRCRLIEEVRNCELDGIEALGRTRIFNGLSKEVQTIAQCGNILGMLAQMGVLLVFATLYLIAVSLTAFVLSLVFTLVAAALYFARVSRMDEAIHQSTVAEYGLHGLLTGVLDGFKEIKLNERRSRELTEDVVAASLNAANSRVKAQSEFGQNFVFTQDVFFLLLGTVVFLVPMLSDVSSDTLSKATAAVLFLFAPISAIVSSVPVFANANASAIAITELEQLLRRTNENGPGSAVLDVPGEIRTFRDIELRDVLFRFEDAQTDRPFQVGPINITLRAGETVFISGGNGSGKSTFLRLLTSLYRPQQGEILLDGAPLTRDGVGAYRALFSAVFSDYHLFKRLYGIDPVSLAEAPALLEQFELTDKTTLTGNEFSTIDLSAGQRKRLALIVAMMERRPICVLDEWAADQDPIFRRKFYEELIGQMKAGGITVICVSHDDRYYDLADRRLHLEEGRIVTDTREAPDA
jgi:putative ATP-binding cassette transporter